MMKWVAQTPAGSFWACLRSWHGSFRATGYFSQRVGEQSFRLLIQPGLLQGRAQATLQIGIRQLRNARIKSDQRGGDAGVVKRRGNFARQPAFGMIQIRLGKILNQYQEFDGWSRMMEQVVKTSQKQTLGFT